jgi:DNA-binding response OmpR family regulator
MVDRCVADVSIDAQSPSRRLRIGVADDEPELCALLTRLVERLGHEVVCAAQDGADLIAVCASQPMDLAIVDFDMPFDGLAVADELSKTKGIPVIMISGHLDLNHVVRAHEPVAQYLSKPITIEALDKAIRAATS